MVPIAQNIKSFRILLPYIKNTDAYLDFLIFALKECAKINDARYKPFIFVFDQNLMVI